MTKRLLPLMMLVTLTGCANLPKPWQPHEPLREQLSHEAALTVGAEACRMVPVGFAEQHKVRAQVIQLHDAQVTLKLDAGSEPILIDGALYQPNDTFSSQASEWSPCP